MQTVKLARNAAASPEGLCKLPCTPLLLAAGTCGTKDDAAYNSADRSVRSCEADQYVPGDDSCRSQCDKANVPVQLPIAHALLAVTPAPYNHHDFYPLLTSASYRAGCNTCWIVKIHYRARHSYPYPWTNLIYCSGLCVEAGIRRLPVIELCLEGVSLDGQGR